MEREIKTVRTMIGMYCRSRHGGGKALCEDCRSLLLRRKKDREMSLRGKQTGVQQVSDPLLQTGDEKTDRRGNEIRRAEDDIPPSGHGPPASHHSAGLNARTGQGVLTAIRYKKSIKKQHGIPDRIRKGNRNMDQANPTLPSDFIRDIIEEDMKTGKHRGRVATRFPPEPNGYPHIGHAKSVCLNFGIAAQYGGTCNLRMDDTDPSGESMEYVESLIRDVKWLGFDWQGRLYYASDYYEKPGPSLLCL